MTTVDNNIVIRRNIRSPSGPIPLSENNFVKKSAAEIPRMLKNELTILSKQIKDARQ
jgi:hypothetical protein